MTDGIFNHGEGETESEFAYSVHMSDGDIAEGDGLVWKEIMREGTWQYSPGPDGPVKRELKIVGGHSSSPDEIGFADLKEAFDAKAIDHVTIPTSHDDKPHENTGYIRKLEIGERDGKAILVAGLDFTEPDVKGKALRGSIANTSAGIIPQYINKLTGKLYKFALGHVALTNKPWLSGMTPFGVETSFSEENIMLVTLSGEKDTDESEENLEEGSADDQNQDTSDTESADGENEEVVEEVTDEGADSGASNDDKDKEGGNDMSDKSTEGAESKTELSDEAKAILAAHETKFSEQIEAQRLENEKLRDQVHVAKVEKSIEDLKTVPAFSEATGFLAKVREIKLADKGEKTVINLSETVDGSSKEVSLSVSDAIDAVIAAIPSESLTTKLAEEFSEVDALFPQKSTGDETNLSDDEKADKLAEEWGLDLPKVGA